MSQHLIVNALVITGGEKPRVIPGGAVAYADGKILAVGSTAELEKKYPDATRRDAAGLVVMPGFICAHHHLYSTMARGMGIPGEPAANFTEILERLWWKLDRALTADDVYYSALVPLIECIRNGTTTIIDHHASPECRDGSLKLIAKAVRKAGIRASLCYEVSDRNADGAGIRENVSFIKKLQRKPDPRLHALFGLHASFTVSDKTLKQCVEKGKELGAGFHIHVAEDQADVDDSLKQYGMRCVERLDRAGVTGPNSVFCHCIHIDEKEMEILARTGTNVVHNPESNMNNAVGVAKVLTMLKKGCLVGLGTDGMSSDMPAQMRCAYLLHRLDQRDPRVAFCEAPQLLLQNNARIANKFFPVGLGELKAGHAADLVILDYVPPTPLNDGNFLGHLIFGMVDATVDTTICAGKTLMKHKKITTLDVEEICAKSRELAPQMWSRLR